MIETFEEAQEVFAKALPGYTRRPHQMGLAAKIEEIYAAARGGVIRHGVLQAGTGTGKSFAILIPAAIAAKMPGARLRTVVATSTKMLQTQYAKGDLPFLTEHLGVDFTYAVLKGRSNYPCHAKAAEIEHPVGIQRMIKDRMEQAAADPAGIIDREDFPEVLDEDFKPFSMSATECPGAKSCPFASRCFAERAKDKAATADVVITNTAMLLLDLRLRQQTQGKVSLLGDFDVLAVDEAHELPDAATRTLEDTINASTLRKLGRDMGAYLMREEGDAAAAEKIEQAVDALWAQAQMLYDEFAARTPGKFDPMLLPPATIIEKLGEGVMGLYQAIWDARDAIKATPPLDPDDDKAKVQRQRLLRRSEDWKSRLKAFATDSPDKTVRWAERETWTRHGEQQTRLVLRSAPISVAEFLRSAMFDVVPTILSSATLAAGTKNGRPDFSYLMETVGLADEGTLQFDAGSPFDYPAQARLFVPGKGFPEPSPKNTAAWRAAAQAATRELVLKSGGGALLLFTSTSAMREAHRALSLDFRQAGLKVLIQGELPNGELIRAFKEDGNAVLFGLKSFMVGVDVPGKALRLVVLDKLPFAVPTDLLYQARCEAVVRKHGPWADFNKMTVPMMTLTLTQAFGRLIRHLDDRGMVAILDSRLHTKGYGKKILTSLPPAGRLDTIGPATAFLESVR